jgi:hypothetical protein
LRENHGHTCAALLPGADQRALAAYLKQETSIQRRFAGTYFISMAECSGTILSIRSKSGMKFFNTPGITLALNTPRFAAHLTYPFIVIAGN